MPRNPPPERRGGEDYRAADLALALIAAVGFTAALIIALTGAHP